jgi:hypothetical protein
VVETLEVAALALPVADGEVDELELETLRKSVMGKTRGEDRLQAVVLALLGQLVHLQEALVAAALDFDQVGNLDGGGDLGKIETAADRARSGILEGDGELGLLDGRRGCRSGCCTAGNDDRSGGRGRNAEALFELLDEGCRVQEGQPNNLFFQLLQICHFVLHVILNFALRHLANARWLPL